ncbi:MAG: OmpA family protein [Moraxellaceae bacterium]
MTNYKHIPRLSVAITLSAAALTLLACQSVPVQDPAVDTARLELTQLQNDTLLASHAPAAIKDAVEAAEKPQTDAAVKSHLAYLAGNKVKTAKAMATTRYNEDQLKTAASSREKVRLDARTQEADQANVQAESSRIQATEAEQKMAIAEQSAMAANQKASLAEQKVGDIGARNASLEKELADLHARKTERGIVLTFGDVLFATGKSDIKAGAMANFDRLADSLKKQEGGRITIEGHTDSVGSDASNITLSQRRAESVRSYLVSRGVAAETISATGKGSAFPVTSNASAAGRQKNRRVEVIIDDSASKAVV